MSEPSQNAPSERLEAIAISLRHPARPWTLNSERAGHWRKHRALTDEWRGVFHLLAVELQLPHLERIAVTVQPEVRNRAHMPDTGACIGAAKAAIDGLVDAGVLADDGPAYVRRLTFEAPVITGEDALTLTLREVPE